MSSRPVSVIVAALVGALASVIGDSLDLGVGTSVSIGVFARIIALAGLILGIAWQVNFTWDRHRHV